MLLLSAFRYLVHPFLTSILDRQLLGLGETLALIAVLFGYLALCAVPPFLWSRSSLYHPVWRGIEALVCYVVVAIVMGGIFTLESGTRWSVLSGLWAGGNAWGKIGSLVVLSGVFILASLWGGMTAEGKTRRHKSKTRRRKT